MSVVHVIPLGDLIEHHVPGGLDGHAADEGAWLCLECPDEDVDCACMPTVEQTLGADDRPRGWMWTHNALDGRP